MFKIKVEVKRRNLDFIDKDKNTIDKISDFTTFVYPRGVDRPKVSEYHYVRDKNNWFFHNTLVWDDYISAKKILTS